MTLVDSEGKEYIYIRWRSLHESKNFRTRIGEKTESKNLKKRKKEKLGHWVDYLKNFYSRSILNKAIAKDSMKFSFRATKIFGMKRITGLRERGQVLPQDYAQKGGKIRNSG